MAIAVLLSWLLPRLYIALIFTIAMTPMATPLSILVFLSESLLLAWLLVRP